MTTQINLPRDAEGREIPLDVEFLYSATGEQVKPYSFTFRHYGVFGWEMHIVGAPNLVYDPRSFYLTPPDSWEKLEEDLKNAADAANRSLSASCCTWFNGDKGCVDCPADEVNDETCGSQFINDIAARIRKLRGEGE